MEEKHILRFNFTKSFFKENIAQKREENPGYGAERAVERG